MRWMASLLVLAAACGDDDASPVDAGVASDAGPPLPTDGGTPDAGPDYVCDVVVALAGELGTVSVDASTDDVATAPRDLGLACGNVEASRWAPQVVVEYTVPGSGTVAIEATLANDATDAMFDSVLQVRRGVCETIPEGGFPPSCFDDTSGSELRSTANLTAEGGETLYFFVTGFSDTPAEGYTDRAAAELQVTATAASLTELEEALAFALGADSFFEVRGSDADGDAAGLMVVLRDASGGIVDLDGDGDGDGADIIARFFDEDVEGMTEFTGSTRLDGIELGMRGAVEAEMRIFDSAFGMSDALTVGIEDGTTAGFMEACDRSERIFCRSPMVCEEMICVATGPVGEACEGARELGIDPPETEATTITVSGSIGSGEGDFTGSCGMTQGAETIYAVEVPVTADLLLSTDDDASGDTDTLLYVREACPDPSTELGCNDDIDTPGMMYRSELELEALAPGTYAIFVETYGGLGSGTAPFGLVATLRPVLDGGESCDDEEILNRCADGACSEGTCP